jgi:hypothetical protein
MINVACFCGCSYSFTGDAGVCPQCGEAVTFTGAPVTEAQDQRDQLGRLSKRSVHDVPPEEMAA